MTRPNQSGPAAAPAARAVPLVIGVTSHRNIAPNEEEAIRQRVRDFLTGLQRDFPGLPLLVLSSLAEGGDRWVAEEALALGVRLIAPLPMMRAQYTQDFSDADDTGEIRQTVGAGRDHRGACRDG